jgi:hypothetical protein
MKAVFRQKPPLRVCPELDRPKQRERFGETGSVLPKRTVWRGAVSILSTKWIASGCSGCAQSSDNVRNSAFVVLEFGIRVSRVEPL